MYKILPNIININKNKLSDYFPINLYEGRNYIESGYKGKQS